MTEIQFDRVHKLFGDVVAVDDLTLNIVDGEFLVLVGPSGCGKTTSLRMLAGFERPTYGELRIDGEVQNAVPPQKRDLAMVFQSYALYPHMNVYKNLAFGMKVRRESRDVIKTRVEEVAELLGLESMLDRRPAELSGGQRQRVALGRALLREPRAFLMDEPLSNLDAALRVQMRVELKRLHERLGVTTVYVTHDQVEAMTMGTRIAIMDGGRLQQVDTPEEIYARPANLFVAGFIGSPKMNFIPASTTSVASGAGVAVLGKTIAHTSAPAGEVELILGVRAEDVHLASDAPDACTLRFSGTVDVVEPLGSETFVVVDVQGQSITARFPPRTMAAPGDQVELAVAPEHTHLFEAASGQNVAGVRRA